MPNPVLNRRVVLAGAVPFSPRSLPNLAGWWKADAGVTIATGVSNWADQSGNGRTFTQAVGAMQPTFTTNQLNGLPSLDFDGTTDSMATAVFSLVQPFTIYMLLKQRSFTINSRWLDGTTINTAVMRQRGAAGDIGIYAGTTLDGTGNTQGSWMILTAVFNGTSSLLEINNTATATGSAGTDAPGGLNIMSQAGGVGVNADAQLVEMLCRNAADNSTTRTLNKNYLAARGGLSI